MGMIGGARFVGLSVLFGSILLGAIFFVLPVGKLTPLIGRDGWAVTDGFVEYGSVHPAILEVHKAVLQSPETRFWRSWSPTVGAMRGRLETKPFDLPAYLVVPYGGFAHEASNIELELECLGDESRLPIAFARTNNDWSEVFMPVPPGWCGGRVRMIAETQSTTDWIAVGTPFGATRLMWLKRTAPAVIFDHAILFALFASFFVIAMGAPGNTRTPLASLTLGSLLLGAGGLTTFYVFFASPLFGGMFAGVMIACLLAMSGRNLAVWLRRSERHDFIETLLLWYLITLVYVLLLYATDTGAGAWHPNARFAPVMWSTDNQLPRMVADALYQGRQLPGLLGAWQVSDRPPLQAGLLVLARVLFAPFNALGVELFAVQRWYEVAGLIVNGIWVLPVATGLALMKLGGRQVRLGTVLVALSSLAIFNTIYVWPKLIGGAFALTAFFLAWAVATRIGPGEKLADGERPVLFAVLGALAAFSLMCHGGTFFGLVVLGLWVAWRFRRDIAVGAPIAAAAFLGIVIPWLAWQHFVEPPGNALAKFALAGTFGMKEHDIGLWQTIHRSYAGISFFDWLHMKRDAFSILAGLQPSPCGVGELRPYSSDVFSAGRYRAFDFIYVLPSFRFFWLGLPPLLIPALRRPVDDDALRAGRTMLVLGLATIALTALVMWKCFIVHDQSYEALLWLLVAFSWGLIVARIWYRTLGLALCAIYAGVVWGIAPFFGQIRVEADITVALVAVILLAILLPGGREAEAAR